MKGTLRNKFRDSEIAAPNHLPRSIVPVAVETGHARSLSEAEGHAPSPPARSAMHGTPKENPAGEPQGNDIVKSTAM